MNVKTCNCDRIGITENEKHSRECPVWQWELPTNKKFKLFKSPLCQWNGVSPYETEYRELISQIYELLSINSGLAQGNMCYSDEGYKNQMELVTSETLRAKELGESIKSALCIK